MQEKETKTNSTSNFFRRELRGKLRIWGSWLLVPLIFWSVERSPEIDGVLILVLGTFLRFWASGFLRKEGTLCIAGPYRFTRNPLYLGSILMVVGIPISQDAWGITAFVFALSLVMFYPLIGTEEKVLTEKFGQPYQDYLRTVPRLFSPVIFFRPSFWREATTYGASLFSWELWKKNKGWEPLLISGSVLLISFLIPILT